MCLTYLVGLLYNLNFGNSSTPYSTGFSAGIRQRFHNLWLRAGGVYNNNY